MIFKSAAASQASSVAGFVLITAATVGLPQVEGVQNWFSNMKASLPTSAETLTSEPEIEVAPAPIAQQDGAAPTDPNSEELAVAAAPLEEAEEPQIQTTDPVTGPVIDLLRVEPDGNTLVSGSAEAGAQVMLKSGDETIGETTADASGNFVILPDNFLPEGDHQLTVTSKKPAGEASGPQAIESVGQQTAIVAIPEKGKESELLAVLTTNEGPSLILEKPEREAAEQTQIASAPKVEPKADLKAEPVVEPSLPTVRPEVEPGAQVAIVEPNNEADTELHAQDVEVAEPAVAPPKPSAVTNSTVARIEAIETEDKRMFVAGAAQKGAKLRLYLDDRFLGATIGGDGDRFLFERSIAIEPGQYRIRIDQLGPDGAVVSRAQVPFTREDDRQLQASLVQPSPVNPVDPGAATPARPSAEGETDDASPKRIGEVAGPMALDKVADQQLEAAVPTTAFEVTGTSDKSVIIRRGDSLWRISRRVYGQGIRYTTIFLANRDQIQDPDRIFPGQIFGLPEDENRGEAVEPGEGAAASDDS
ncbi:MAG: Ig-like domain-containing protein [Pseudomonadota bacterium]